MCEALHTLLTEASVYVNDKFEVGQVLTCRQPNTVA